MKFVWIPNLACTKAYFQSVFMVLIMQLDILMYSISWKHSKRLWCQCKIMLLIQIKCEKRIGLLFEKPKGNRIECQMLEFESRTLESWFPSDGVHYGDEWNPRIVRYKSYTSNNGNTREREISLYLFLTYDSFQSLVYIDKWLDRIYSQQTDIGR